jgi:hypothetical protein
MTKTAPEQTAVGAVEADAFAALAHRVPDEAFKQTWGPAMEITDWDDWVLAPEVLNFTEAAAWSRRVGSRQTIPLSSGDTLVRLPGQHAQTEAD